MKSRDASRLRKAHYLELCWHWKYVSPFWQQRKRYLPFAAAAAAAAAASTAVAAAASTEPRRPAKKLAVAAFLPKAPGRVPQAQLESFNRMLSLDIREFGALDSAFVVFAAADAEPRAPLTILLPILVSAMIKVAISRLADARSSEAALRASAAACNYEEELRGNETADADEHLLRFAFMMSSHDTSKRMLTPEVLAQLSAPDAACMQDVALASQSCKQFICRAQTELGALRISSQVHRSLLLTAAADVCAACVEMNVIVLRRMEARMAIAAPRFAERELQRCSGTISPYARKLAQEYVRLSGSFEPRVSGELSTLLRNIAGT